MSVKKFWLLNVVTFYIAYDSVFFNFHVNDKFCLILVQVLLCASSSTLWDICCM